MKKQLLKKLSTSGKTPCLTFTKEINMCNITPDTIVNIQFKKKGTRIIIDILSDEQIKEKLLKKKKVKKD